MSDLTAIPPKPVAWLVTGDHEDDLIFCDLQEARDACDQDRPADVDDVHWHREITPLVPQAKGVAATDPLYARVAAWLAKEVEHAIWERGGLDHTVAAAFLLASSMEAQHHLNVLRDHRAEERDREREARQQQEMSSVMESLKELLPHARLGRARTAPARSRKVAKPTPAKRTRGAAAPKRR